MTPSWTPSAKKGLIKWAQYSLPSYRSETLKNEEEKFVFIRDCFLEKMPQNLKEILLVSDEKFAEWFVARENAAFNLMTMFQLAGDSPSFGFSTGEHFFTPAYGTVGRHWTAFSSMIEQLSECVLGLEAAKHLRTDYLAHLAKEIAGAKKELEAAQQR